MGRLSSLGTRRAGERRRSRRAVQRSSKRFGRGRVRCPPRARVPCFLKPQRRIRKTKAATRLTRVMHALESRQESGVRGADAPGHRGSHRLHEIPNAREACCLRNAPSAADGADAGRKGRHGSTKPSRLRAWAQRSYARPWLNIPLAISAWHEHGAKSSPGNTVVLKPRATRRGTPWHVVGAGMRRWACLRRRVKLSFTGERQSGVVGDHICASAERFCVVHLRLQVTLGVVASTSIAA
jgi:hypothetical protein